MASDVRDGVAAKLPFNRGEFFAQKLEELFTVNGGGCAQAAFLIRRVFYHGDMESRRKRKNTSADVSVLDLPIAFLCVSVSPW